MNRRVPSDRRNRELGIGAVEEVDAQLANRFSKLKRQPHIKKLLEPGESHRFDRDGVRELGPLSMVQGAVYEEHVPMTITTGRQGTDEFTNHPLDAGTQSKKGPCINPNRQ